MGDEFDDDTRDLDGYPVREDANNDDDPDDFDDETNELDQPVAPPPRRTAMHERFVARRRAVEKDGRRKERFRLWLTVSIAVAVSIAAILAFTPVLGIDRIVVKGIDGPRKAEIEDAASAQLGRPALMVDEAALPNAVDAISGVAGVQVTVGWPRTINIAAQPLEPVAYALTPDGRVASVDGEGTVLVVGDAVPQNIVRLEGAVVPAAAGGRVPDELLDTLTVADALTSRLASYVVTVSTSDRYGVEMRLDGLGEVIVGDTKQLENKIRAVETVLSGGVELGCIAKIDVRVPTAVTVSRDRNCTGEAPLPPLPTQPETTANENDTENTESTDTTTDGGEGQDEAGENGDVVDGETDAEDSSATVTTGEDAATESGDSASTTTEQGR